MSRVDLFALTPEALVRLANVGLVKRAQKELASGVRPALVEEPDGTIVARARDGATTRLPHGVPLARTSCTCGASKVCRHRIAAVLAYQREHAAPATAGQDWSPGTIDDATLLDACGARIVARADALGARGVVVTTRPGTRTPEGTALPPTAVLPTATVQFLVPGELAYAKCDCAKGDACEHVVLAVRAFRACPAGGVVTLGAVTTTSQVTEPTPARALVLDALEHLVRYGVVAPGSDARLAQARGAAEREHWWWIVDGIEAVERLADAYQRQSTRFSLAALAREVGELIARVRASNAPGSPLAPAWLLGSDQAGETAMEQVRLLALGVRLEADGDRRIARLYFADPDTANVLVLEKTWTGESRSGAALGSLFASSRMSVADLARGELVTRAARRRPNGALDLGAARGMKSSLLPTTGSWTRISEPLLVRDLAARAARRRTLPPRCLCPRGLGADVVVVELARVASIDVPADRQWVTGLVEDSAGNRLIVHTAHREVSPGAVDAAAAALRAGPSHVAGELYETVDGWRMDPVAYLAPDLVVLDLQREGAWPAPDLEREDEDDPGTFAPDASPAARLSDATRDYVGRTLLQGCRTTTATASALAGDAERVFARRLAPLFGRAAGGDIGAILDLAILHQLATAL